MSVSDTTASTTPVHLNHSICLLISFSIFFFNDTATTEIYTLSLHDALPIFVLPRVYGRSLDALLRPPSATARAPHRQYTQRDRKSTRLNSSHTVISYAVFCLKKKIAKAPGDSRQ